MGSNNTKRQGGMILNFDRSHYYPGDVVTGTIYLNVLEAFETRGLELTLKIKEKVKWVETEYKTEMLREYDETVKEWREKPHQKEIKIERKDKKTLFQNSSIIGTMMNNMFGYGHYAYPFQFVLPYHLPGSFEFYDHDVSANIEYLVKATTLSIHGKEFQLETKGILVVRQSPQNFEYPTNLSDTKNISTWCFFDQGTSTLNISYPKNNFCLDETVQVICQLNNSRCKINSTCVKLQLFQRITLKAEGFIGRSKFLSRCLAESRYDGNYPAGQESLTTLELRMSDLNNPTLRHLEKCKHRHLFRDVNQVAKLQATVKSRLIECGYFLRATTEFASCMCCSGIPTIDIPVLIYIPEIFNDINQFRPQNWNPQVMPMYQMNIPTAEQLGISNGISVNVNVNVNPNQNNQAGGGMIQTCYEPIQNDNNSNNMMSNPSQPTMNNGNQGGMMSNPSQPMMNNPSQPMMNNGNQGGMMTTSFQPTKNY